MDKKKEVIIYGAGGHGKVIADILEYSFFYEVKGFLDGNKEEGEVFFGYPVLGDESYFNDNANTNCIVAIGDNWVRSLVVKKILSVCPDVNFINAIHHSAQIAEGVKFGEGNVVMANVVINSDTKLGNHCIVNTKSSIDHDCDIDNFSTIAPGATLGGNTNVGEYSTVSLGANVIHGINIGKHTVIGAGATVLNNVESHAVAYGTPAKVVRKRKENDKYL